MISLCTGQTDKNKADKSASNSLNSSIFEGLVTLCAPDAVCFSRHVPHASGRILAERFYVIGTLQSNFLLHEKIPESPSPYGDQGFWHFSYSCILIHPRRLKKAQGCAEGNGEFPFAVFFTCQCKLTGSRAVP